MGRVLAALAGARSVLAIVVAALAGILVPPPPDAAALVAPVVAVLLFTSLSGFSASVLSGRSVAAVGLALAVGYGLLPGLAALVGPPLLPGPAFRGLFVVVAGPTTVGSAIVWTRLDDGDVDLATAVAVVSVAVSPVAVPAVFAAFRSATVAVDPVSVGLDLLGVLGGGVLLTILVPARRLRERNLDRLAVAAVAVLVYLAVGTTGLGGATPAVGLAVVAAVLATDGVVRLAVAAGGRSLGLPADARRAVAYAAGLKNLGVALLVAASVGGTPVLPVVGFYVGQQLLAAVRAELPAGWRSR